MRASSVIALLAAVILMAGAVVADDHDHDHGHGGEQCACVAEELNFAIDCTTAGEQAVTDAYNFLVTNNCATGDACHDNADCQKNYYIIESHHDHCPSTPEAVEKGIHDFEAGCDSCIIARQYNSNLPQCTQPQCDQSVVASTAYNTLISNNCNVSCTADVCGDNYKIIRAYHDMCGEDDITQDIEEGIHDFEDACAAQGCNAVSEAFTPTCSKVSASSSVAPAVQSLLLPILSLLAVVALFASS